MLLGTRLARYASLQVRQALKPSAEAPCVANEQTALFGAGQTGLTPPGTVCTIGFEPSPQSESWDEAHRMNGGHSEVAGLHAHRSLAPFGTATGIGH